MGNKFRHRVGGRAFTGAGNNMNKSSMVEPGEAIAWYEGRDLK